MTRFGVMKHLKVLEEAGVVTTRREGREKLHFLNPVPIRLVHDRWVSKFAEPRAATLSGLKTYLEDEDMTTVKTVSWAEGTAPVAEGTAVFEVFIKTTPERLWEAITDPAQRAIYSFGVQTQSDWTSGSDYTAGIPGVVDISSGTNIEVDPPHLLVQTFDALWSDDVKAQGTTRVTREIEQVGTSCRLTVIHDGLPARANPELYGGWPMILSGLKTLPGDRRAARHPRLADVLLRGDRRRSLGNPPGHRGAVRRLRRRHQPQPARHALLVPVAPVAGRADRRARRRQP
ncbi:ArsR/SmtB family transcription factor [Nocardioides sp. B-3]|uniref:ArsR/SmtB family transcription factor n=1 Tax=Nocardioides sp. B-3 TaxID=2895565 RepID=UPI002152B1A3|nr:SRPBCC domain-containing protein [Nocardioides sp. B-3]UUZ58359.1 SRPBCC domain-containing protein [Nocardioides sp. B-3]